MFEQQEPRKAAAAAVAAAAGDCSQLSPGALAAAVAVPVVAVGARY
jgi:hypothetical protein